MVSFSRNVLCIISLSLDGIGTTEKNAPFRVNEEFKLDDINYCKYLSIA